MSVQKETKTEHKPIIGDRAIVARVAGGPQVLEETEVPAAVAGPGEVLVRHEAIGVNFIDTYFRSGLYPWPQAPLIPGAEAAGVVEATGPGVTGFAPGDRVAAITPTGAYRTRRALPAGRLVKLPEAISTTAAAVLLKGLTAHYLLNDSHPVKPGDIVLVHAAAGGVGQLLGPWLADLGALAIGTAGGPRKVAVAKACGYAHVIDYRSEDFVARIGAITGGRGCDAVYDSVGADTWRGSLACLRTRGTFVSFGQSSGPIEGFRFADLARGSLTATRPMLFDFIAEPAELARRSAALFARLAAAPAQQVRVLPLGEAAAAHAALESRQTAGPTVLVP